MPGRNGMHGGDGVGSLNQTGPHCRGALLALLSLSFHICARMNHIGECAKCAGIGSLICIFLESEANTAAQPVAGLVSGIALVVQRAPERDLTHRQTTITVDPCLPARVEHRGFRGGLHATDLALLVRPTASDSDLYLSVSISTCSGSSRPRCR